MLTPELSAKINNYVQTHGLSLKPQIEVLSDMLNSGLLTLAEYNEAMNGNIFALENTTTLPVGDNVTLTTPTEPLIQYQKPKAKHPLFNFLDLNSSGKIDMEQFSLTALKQKYPEDKYEITEKQNQVNNNITHIRIKDKQTNKVIFDISTDKKCNENTVMYFNNKEHFSGMVTIADGIITDTSRNNEDGSSQRLYYANGDISNICRKEDYNTDGSYTVTEYSKRTSSRKFDKDNNFLEGELIANGVKYGECNQFGTQTKNYIIDEFFNIIENDNSEQKGEKLVTLIKQRINKSNIADFINNYEDETDSFIIDDIAEYDFLNTNQILEIREHIQKLTRSLLEHDKQTEILKDNITTAYLKNDIEKFKSSILKITPDNAYTIENAFGRYETDEEYLGKESLSTLIRLIDNIEMSDEDKLICKKHLVDTLIKSCEDLGIFVDDIKSDIKSHYNDERKFNIDYLRLVCRSNSDPSDEKISEPNGEIDLDFVQGNIGDCWLVAGLKLINHKNGGKEFIKSMLKVDKANKTITVTLPGVSKSYTITFDEINKANHLATGDGDARAIEIAMDRYIKEYAYNGGDDQIDGKIYDTVDSTTIMTDDLDPLSVERYDLNADNTSFLFKILFGNKDTCTDTDMMESHFNDNNAVHILSIEEDEAVPVIFEDGSEGYLDASHAYMIDSSDEHYVYLVDPREPEYKKITVKRKNFKDIKVETETSYIKPNQKP